jgi:flagellar biosynthesis/type III secretory pathway protein FliH
VSGEDLERIRAIEPRIREAVDGLDRLEVVEDPRVDSGLIAETRHGTVDATIDGQIRMILEAIEHELHEESREGQ